MRAIYIARGSSLLPPAFASLFDDSSQSSLDVFFDPSNGSVDMQGLTLGTVCSSLLHIYIRESDSCQRNTTSIFASYIRPLTSVDHVF